ncbi:Carboxylesterase NlhH [Seminavis robusta]|uniref:Carboxylesterase NlhH n=1 Tax=Seminavis robusta TaxID=568900 RepID=A0A9N8EYA8_9STRA|nr:Carboxylesterase NlhH [Seminavis robusta]|eukprot:Sro2518_g330080.1 Carboxylesterase NlhH (485) ;mRNA; r:9175-10755
MTEHPLTVVPPPQDDDDPTNNNDGPNRTSESPSKLAAVANAALDAVVKPLEDYEFSIKAILGSIAARAAVDRNGTVHSEPTDSLPHMLRHIPLREQAVQSLLEQGAAWKPIQEIHHVKVHRLADVPYGKEPVYIHIHGGGWSRGKKDSGFYGGPAMCQNVTADTGCISVAIGYRLGHYPEFIYDAALAIRWVYDHIDSLGGDTSNVFLSGHSAGAHIASLLTIRHFTFLQEPFGIPRDFFKGVILVSGVYDLFSPMRSNAIDFKNKWLFLYYVTPAFGTDAKLKREASPLLLLDPNKDTSIWGTAVTNLQRRVSKVSERVVPLVPDKLLPEKIRSSMTSNAEDSMELLLEWEWNGGGLESHNYQPPSTLILNATFDMGLQENGQLMAEALGEHTTVKYQIIEGSDHASICWNDTTAETVADFVRSKLTTTTSCAEQESPVCEVTTLTTGRMGSENVIGDVPPSPPRTRRGKRDKIPRKEPEVDS